MIGCCCHEGDIHPAGPKLELLPGGGGVVLGLNWDLPRGRGVIRGLTDYFLLLYETSDVFCRFCDPDPTFPGCHLHQDLLPAATVLYQQPKPEPLTWLGLLFLQIRFLLKRPVRSVKRNQIDPKNLDIRWEGVCASRGAAWRKMTLQIYRSGPGIWIRGGRRRSREEPELVPALCHSVSCSEETSTWWDEAPLCVCVCVPQIRLQQQQMMMMMN